MIYPMVLGILTVAVVILMLVVVLPSFIGVIESGGNRNPVADAHPSRFKRFYPAFLVAAGGVIILLVIGWRGFLSAARRGIWWWDGFKLNMPIVGKSLRMIYSARFARTLSTLVSSGLQMLSAIEITARVVGNKLDP